MTSGFIPLYTSAPRSRVEWELEDDVKVPESELQDTILDLLKAILLAWAAREANGAHVMRNRAIRWDKEHPRVGVDPDIAVLPVAPPEGAALRSVRTWREGHYPPFLAVEVVSENHPWKDYAVAPEKYAANGTEELWVYDPELVGPKVGGGPFILQVWRRRDDGGFERTYAGLAPYRSKRLGAWILQMPDNMLRIADDRDGNHLWLTEAETERGLKESALRDKESALRDNAELNAKVAELEAKLAKLKTEAGEDP